MSNERNKVEALLFASARRMHIDEIAKLTGLRNMDKIKAALVELKINFEEKGGSMVLQNDGDYWKLTIKDHYMPIIHKVVSQTELDKPLMETLAVIAWKYPVLQAEVIKIRHNKAYEHLKQLEELGFVTRQRFGRTNKLTLTTKFFEYFDLPTKEQAKEVFKNIVPEKVKEKFDYILMPRPNLKETFLEPAIKVSKKGTKIFYHGFGKKEDVLKEVKKSIGKRIEGMKVKRAGDIGINKYRWRITFSVK